MAIGIQLVAAFEWVLWNFLKPCEPDQIRKGVRGLTGFLAIGSFGLLKADKPPQLVLALVQIPLQLSVSGRFRHCLNHFQGLLGAGS
ncbi:hypothetical protein AN478_02255 [Thiohalorhabdus denitrificans]|nr:hypothetical protein AN478_02255 [Thiohalorhabdus denitrificans]